MTNDEIEESGGDLCPSTACGSGSEDYVYSPYFEICIPTSCPTQEPTRFFVVLL